MVCALALCACNGSASPLASQAGGPDSAGSGDGGNAGGDRNGAAADAAPAVESGDGATADAAPAVESGATDAPPATDTGGSSTLVQVSTGWLRGAIEAETVSFRGIPYASPPVGSLRWARPAAPPSWTGIRDATAFGNHCLQFDNTGLPDDEDCLFVNVWTPLTRPSTTLPVIVFIHGGDWINGAGSYSAYDGSLLAQSGPAVVVTLCVPETLRGLFQKLCGLPECLG
jgi:hypothetical protein